MKQKIAILGSTGSIGKSLLRIIKNDNNNFEITLLSINKNYKDLLKQTKFFDVKNVIIKNKNAYHKFKLLNKNKNIKIHNNFCDLKKIFKKKIDYIMCSIIGIEGLEPTLKSIRYTKNIAIANKESIICGWNLIKKDLKKYKTNFVPVDSEHFSIWYALKKYNNLNIKRIHLTASGGPLLNVPLYKYNSLKIKDILKHPNWKMGKKISIDSATMMNKVFEVIEARNIFNIPLKKISILIHPKSYVHAIINFNDGMIKIIAHETTMDIPIFNSLYNKKAFHYKSKNLDLKKINNLNLSAIKNKKFEIIDVLKFLPRKISLFETVLVSANDEFVRLYLEKKINYKDISKKLIKFLKLKEFLKYKKKQANKLSDIIDLDQYVRLKILSLGV